MEADMSSTSINRQLFEDFILKHQKETITDQRILELVFPLDGHPSESGDRKPIQPISKDVFNDRLLNSLDCLEQLMREKNDLFEQKCLNLNDKIPNILDQIQTIRLEAYRVQSEITEAKAKLEDLSCLKSNSLVVDRQELMLSKAKLEESLSELKLLNLKQTYKHSLSASLQSEWQRLIRSEMLREPVSSSWLFTFYEHLGKSWIAYRDQIYQKFELELRNTNEKARVLTNEDICFQVLTEAFIDSTENLEPKFEECLQTLVGRASTASAANSSGLLGRSTLQTTEHLLGVFVEMSLALHKFVLDLLKATIDSPINGSARIQDNNFKEFVHHLCSNYQHLLAHYVKIENATAISRLTGHLSQFDLTRNYSVSQIFSILESSLDRASKFIHFGTCASLIIIVQEFLTKFFSHLVNSVNEIKQLATMSSATRGLQPINWSLFHRCLVMIVASGTALTKLENFEDLFKNHIENIRKLLQPIFYLVKKDEPFVLEANQLEAYATFLQIEYTLRPNQRKDFYDLILESSKPQQSTNSQVSETRDLVSDVLFESCHCRLKSINKDFVDLLFSLILDHVCAHLRDGLHLDKLNRSDSHLPDKASPSNETNVLSEYAFTPQPYVTHIGQQLLVINKNIEPYAVENESLMRAFGSVSQISASQYFVREISLKIVRAVLDIYQESLPRLTNLGRRQLVTDMLYLDNVFNDLQVYCGSSHAIFDSFKKIITN